jgi:hypothetical protein
MTLRSRAISRKVLAFLFSLHSGLNEGSFLQELIAKVSTYIPGISMLQQSVFGQGPEEQPRKERCSNDNAPPIRPDHDVQVEEFLRTQYKSKSGPRMPNVGE